MFFVIVLSIVSISLVASIVLKPRKVFAFAYFTHMRDHGAVTVKSSRGLHKEIRPREFKSEMGREAIGSASGEDVKPLQLIYKTNDWMARGLKMTTR